MGSIAGSISLIPLGLNHGALEVFFRDTTRCLNEALWKKCDYQLSKTFFSSNLDNLHTVLKLFSNLQFRRMNVLDKIDFLMLLRISWKNYVLFTWDAIRTISYCYFIPLWHFYHILIFSFTCETTRNVSERNQHCWELIISRRVACEKYFSVNYSLNVSKSFDEQEVADSFKRKQSSQKKLWRFWENSLYFSR